MDLVQLDVFAERPFRGNPLAVFPDAAGLSCHIPRGPNCPKCHSRKLLKIVYGLPAQPPAEGTTSGGCEPQPETHACTECGHRFQRKKQK